MNNPVVRSKGFTLVEVMVSLILATLLVGGVMGAISGALRYSERVKEKSEGRSILEAAAQEILADPEKAEEGQLALEDFPDKPQVSIELTEVLRPDALEVENNYGRLYKVQLKYKNNILNFSLIIPKSGILQ